MGAPVRWGDFQLDAPDLASTARALIRRLGFVYLATTRRRGAPRISPVEAHVVEEDLMVDPEDPQGMGCPAGPSSGDTEPDHRRFRTWI